jgi:hypothetical protein
VVRVMKRNRLSACGEATPTSLADRLLTVG